MVSAKSFTTGKNPVTGDTIKLSGLGKWVIGGALTLMAIKGGSLIANFIQSKIGVSQDDTQLRVV